MIFDQAEWNVRFEWGLAGIYQLAPISDVIVVVDVLSFSTCVDIALTNGAVVFPYGSRDASVHEFAAMKQAYSAQAIRTQSGGFSLSPASLLAIPRDYRLVLPSPNGAALSLAGGTVVTLTGCLRNSRAVAQSASRRGKSIGVIAAGERWADGSLRVCAEDLLGAGAIVCELPGSCSPEAQIAAAAFKSLGPNIASCSSAKELIQRGFERDVLLAADWNVSSTVPVLKESAFVSEVRD